MHTISPEFTSAASTVRTPQLHVRKLRLEVQEADAWEATPRNSLTRARRRLWAVAGWAIGASAVLTWAVWELIR